MWLAILGFVTVEGLIRVFDLYRTMPWVDLPSHFLSGAAVTAVVYRYARVREGTRRPLVAIGGNVLVALVWEALEMLDEVITPDPPHLQDIFLWDGFWDVIAALIGGLALLGLITLRRDLAT